MVLLVVERVPPGLRGELTRWMLEVHPGVFVGTLSSLVRDRLWTRVVDRVRDGAAILVYSTANEQGFTIRTYGPTSREVVDFDGLRLVRTPKE